MDRQRGEEADTQGAGRGALPYYEEVVLSWLYGVQANKLLFIVKSRVEERDERACCVPALVNLQTEACGKAPQLLLEIKSEAIAEVLREEMPELDEVFDTKPSIDAHDLFRHLTPLKERIEKKKAELAVRIRGSTSTEVVAAGPSTELATLTKKAFTIAELEAQIDHVRVLIAMIESEFKATMEKLERLARDNMASFDVLWALFSPEVVAVTEHEDSEEPMGFIVKTIAVRRCPVVRPGGLTST
jgi:hypothetical protein